MKEKKRSEGELTRLVSVGLRNCPLLNGPI